MAGQTVLTHETSTTRPCKALPESLAFNQRGAGDEMCDTACRVCHGFEEIDSEHARCCFSPPRMCNALLNVNNYHQRNMHSTYNITGTRENREMIAIAE